MTTVALTDGHLDALETVARGVWTKQPALTRAFADFGDFLQAYVVSRGGAPLDLVGLFDEAKAFDASQAAHAVARADIARFPITSTAMAPIAERRGGRLVLWLYGPVTIFTDLSPAITEAEVRDALWSNEDAQAIVLRIDCPGGAVHAAERIAIMLSAHPARKIALIDGKCFSAANHFAAAADRVLIRDNASVMLHRSTNSAWGNADQLEAQARDLRHADDFLCRSIANRRHIPLHELRQFLPLERYLSAQEAVDAGLAHAVIPSLPGLEPVLQHQTSES